MPTIVLIVIALWWSFAPAQAQQNGCRTAPLDKQAISNYCASEAYVSRHFPSKSTPGHVAVFSDASGQILADTGSGIDSNVPNAQSGNYPICNGVACNGGVPDCGLTVNWSGAPGTITLPAVTGFPPTCSVRICNVNPNDGNHHAARLSGFPVPSLGRLWPQQCEGVAIENGAWAVTVFPGKFRPNVTPQLFVDNTGSDTNDGLLSNASANALQNPQTCWTIFQHEMELDGMQPGCNLTSGQIFNSGLFCQHAGTSMVYFLSGNGGTATIRNTSGNVVVEESDFCGYIIYQNINIDCTNAASHPCIGIFQHQQNGFDTSTGVGIIGAGTTDIGIACDAMCRIGLGGNPTFSGQFAKLIQAVHSNVNIVNGLTVASGTAIINNIVQLDLASVLAWSGALTISGAPGTSVLAGPVFDAYNNSTVQIANFSVTGAFGGAPSQWKILNNSLLCNASANAIPGAAGINTAAGAAPGIIAAATSGNCGPP